jgi:hypothetical protein
MGCEVLGPGHSRPASVAWSGLDVTFGECGIRSAGNGYEVSLEKGAEYVALELSSQAREVPLEMLLGDSHRKVRWVAFPPDMAVRRVFMDLREREGDVVGFKSDSTFAIRDCDVVYMDAGCPDYELVYDKDMYVYENLAAIRKGLCLDRGVLRRLGGPEGGALAVSGLEEIGDVECGRCEITGYRPEQVLLDVRTEADCFVLFQDVYYPGWKAYVDGKETEILRTDIGMRAVEVPAGSHRVEMTYAPGSLRLGAVLTCLGVILSVAYVLLGRTRNEGKPRPGKHS